MTAGIFSWEGLQSAQSQRTAWFINYCWGAPQSHQQDGDLATKIAEIVMVPVKWKCTMSLTKQQALDLFRSDDLIGLGMEADSLRRKLHPEGVATYIIDRNINYTNFCTEYCTFCAFYAPVKGPGRTKGYVLEMETIYDKIRETVELGGTGVLMQGGLHPDLKIEWYEEMLRGIKQRFPQIHLHCFSASEIIHFADVSGLSIEETIIRLRAAGLDSIPGGGAEILDDEVRYKIARLKCLTDDWLNVHRTAHKLGMRTTATMMFGVGETFEHRINHFQRVYELQEETGGFTAFIPWSFQPGNTALGGRHWEEATAVEYLKVLAIARLYLSNFKNVQSSWVTQGLKVCQLGLRFGGNDVGSVMLEENVVRSAGVTNCTTEEELRRMIRDAGFVPKRRDTLYRQLFLN
ncbi:MAG: cyclic dehypoxanthinyl futalosine synthase [Terriglobales bacterium]